MRAVVVTGLVLFASIPALAYPNGPPSGHDGETVSCTQCHGTNAPPPAIAVTGLDGPFNACDVAHLTLTVTGTQAAAGFEAGTDADTGGTFSIPPGTTGIKVLDTNHEIEHSQPQSFDGSQTASWSFDLTVAPGNHTLFVAANDVNLNGSSSGDHVGTDSFTYTVADGPACEGEGEGGGEGEGAVGGEGEGALGGEGEGEGAAGGEGEGEGAVNPVAPSGCSATSTGADLPALGLAMLALGVSSVRRRRRR